MPEPLQPIWTGQGVVLVLPTLLKTCKMLVEKVVSACPKGSAVLKQCRIVHFPLVHRLRGQGLSLGLPEALGNNSPSFGAVLAAVLPGGPQGDGLYVLEDPDPASQGFVQVRRRLGRPEADLVYIAPRLGEDSGARAAEVWKRLLTEVSVTLGAQGIQRIYAGLPEGSAEVDIFRESGFSLYTRQDLYARLATPLPSAEGVSAWSPRLPAHEWGVQRLYSEVVPWLVQQAEGGLWPDGMAVPRLDLGEEVEFVLVDRGEVIGLVQARSGEKMHWLHVVLHPRAYQWAISAIVCGLSCLSGRGSHQVYCPVREYQGGLRSPLEEAGFQWVASQVLLVKYTMARVREPQTRLVPSVEKRSEAAVPTVVPYHTGRTVK